MSPTVHHDHERLIALSRRQLWFALLAVLVIGTAATGLLAFPGAEPAALATRLFSLLPVALVIAIAALRLRGGASSASMQALVNDELRQASQHRASRNGFIAVLAAQALLAPALALLSMPNQLALMAVLTIVAGVAVFLASLLYHDR
jgi:hypothetical protein